MHHECQLKRQLLFALTFSLSIPPVFAIRTLLGFFESSFNPCLVSITVQWFTVEEQLKIVTIWQTMFALANFVSSIFGYAFYQLNGAAGIRTAGLFNWQWMLLTISLISAIATGESSRRVCPDDSHRLDLLARLARTSSIRI